MRGRLRRGSLGDESPSRALILVRMEARLGNQQWLGRETRQARSQRRVEARGGCMGRQEGNKGRSGKSDGLSIHLEGDKINLSMVEGIGNLGGLLVHAN